MGRHIPAATLGQGYHQITQKPGIVINNQWKQSPNSLKQEILASRRFWLPEKF